MSGAHQRQCPRCQRLRDTAPQSDPEDCPELVRLQDAEALAAYPTARVIRPAPALQKHEKPNTESTAERMRRRRAELALPTAEERPRGGRESDA